MTSKLAKYEIEKMWKEGLKPSVEDIVKMNALGLKIEHGKEATEFTYLPRHSFLGDLILEEPSLYKRIYIDRCFDVLQSDYRTHLFCIAWILNTPDDELPKINSVNNLVDKIDKFKEKILSFTETQILAAIDYAMKGSDATAEEEFYFDDEIGEDDNDVIEAPDQIKSIAQQIYTQMLQVGIPENCVHLTSPVVQRMITNAVIMQGADIHKNEQAQNAAKFQVFTNQLRVRLAEEKSKEANAENENK